MSNDNKTKVLEIQVNVGKSLDNIAKYNMMLEECKAKEKELQKAKQEGTIGDKEYHVTMAALKVDMKEYRDAISANQKQIRNQIKANDENKGSLKALRGELSNATKVYDELSAADRKGAKGKEWQEKINSLTSEIKGAEEETDRFYRNVGNYENAIKSAASSTGLFSTGLGTIKEAFLPFSILLKQVQADVVGITAAYKTNAVAIATMSGATKAAAIASNVLSAAMKILRVALISTGIGAIVVAFGALMAYLTKTQKGTEMLSNAMASFGAAVNVIIDRVAKLGGALVKIFSGNFKGAFADAKSAFAGVGDEMAREIKLAKELSQALVDLEKREVMQSMQTAANANKIKELKLVADDTTKSTKERIAALEEATRLEKESIDAEVANSKLRLANMLGQKEVTKSVEDTLQRIAEGSMSAQEAISSLGLSESTAEDLKEFAGVFNKLQGDMGASVDREREMNNKINSIRKKAGDSRKKMVDDEAKNQKEAKAKERDAIRKAEDAMLAILTDGLLKQQELVNTQYDRQIEDLKTRLETEENLTIEAKKAINDAIIALDKQRDQELKKLSVEQAKKDAEKRAADQAKSLAELKLHWENRINEATLNGQNALQLELERRQAELDAVQRMEGESNEAFRARQLEAQQAYVDAKKAIADKEVEIEQVKMSAIADITGALSGLLEAAGEESKALAKASKVLALGEIAVNTGKAIAAGVAQAQSAPFPGNIAAVATTIATVLANIATATKTVKSAKFATGGVFEGDGYVSGAGTGTSDSINAKLSNGESVNTALATSMFAPLYSTLNQMGGGVPINVAESSNQAVGEAMLARAVARGVAAMPAPVVAVTEINRVGRQVKVVESLNEF